MKNKFLLSLLAGGIVCLATSQISFAATSATQTVTASLDAVRSVVGKGTGLTSTITGATGALTSPLAPSFIISTNCPDSQTLYMTATAPYGVGAIAEQALRTSDGIYIALANTSSGKEATQGAIQNVVGGSPSTTSNGNVIGYLFTPQATSGNLTLGTWDSGNTRWPYTLAQSGDTDVDNSISGSPLSGTYSTDNDECGAYQATITLAFAP